MNKLSNILLLLLISVCAGLPQNEYDYEYEAPAESYDDEETSAVESELPVFEFRSKTITVKEGEDVELSCKTLNPTQDVLIFKKLLNNGEKDKFIYVGEMKVDLKTRFVSDQTTFKLANVTRNDLGVYVCHYQVNEDNELRYTLDVEFPPSVKAKSPPKQRVEKGSDVSVECEASGNPKPVITWSKDSGRLPSGAEKEEGYSMTLENVDRHVEGTYVCTATNGIGNPASASMRLTVTYPPEIITEKAIVRTGEGDKVKLVCIVHARPAAEVSWTKDGSPLTPDNDITETDGGHRHAITISQVTQQHFGAYECHAINEKGESSATINLTDLPRQPHFTSPATSADETSYTLAWETESYYPITDYTVKYRLAKANESTNVPGEWIKLNVSISDDEILSEGLVHQMKHTINDLVPATDYVAVVSVKNQFKWGEEGVFNFSTRKASPTTTTTTTIATSTSLPLAEEKVQYPHEETMSLHKTSTGGVSRLALSIGLMISSVLLSLSS